MADAGLDQLRPIVARWWETSRPHITTDDFTTTWADFLHAFERAKLPLSADVAGAAFARARERVQDDDRQLLIEACRELQAVKGHGEGGQLLPFSLSCSQVARHLWGSDEKSLRWKASRWLKMLCREGVLELVTKGNAGPAGSPASRYRFIEGNPND
ncbi:MAG: hypothetical protein EA377_13420 [Phycisphaerales bacterium]|nr:MAG: hypothetical protein EA377_13420 [Phycisphaerales bacterium]